MSHVGEPFDGSDFEDACEDCGAPAGAMCFDNCPSGYSSVMRERHAEQIREKEKNGRNARQGN